MAGDAANRGKHIISAAKSMKREGAGRFNDRLVPLQMLAVCRRHGLFAAISRWENRGETDVRRGSGEPTDPSLQLHTAFQSRCDEMGGCLAPREGVPRHEANVGGPAAAKETLRQQSLDRRPSLRERCLTLRIGAGATAGSPDGYPTEHASVVSIISRSMGPASGHVVRERSIKTRVRIDAAFLQLPDSAFNFRNATQPRQPQASRSREILFVARFANQSTESQVFEHDTGIGEHSQASIESPNTELQVAVPASISGRADRRTTPRERACLESGDQPQAPDPEALFLAGSPGGQTAQPTSYRNVARVGAAGGLFERAQLEAVQGHLPKTLPGLVGFAYITGWRVPSEVQPLEWRRVDFAAGTERLDPGTTKNGDGRLFPMTAELRAILEEQRTYTDAVQREKDAVVPFVFHRKGKPVTAFAKAWRLASGAAGCPGRIPHDFRRTAVRNLVRSGVPERVAMQMTGHKTPSVFARYNIVNEADLFDAARRYEGAPQPARFG
jgi:hypothetical protein